MAPTKIKATSKQQDVTICYAHTNVCSWYIDNNKGRRKLLQLHLYIQTEHDPSTTFVDIGQVKGVFEGRECEDGSFLHHCIEVVVGLTNYQLLVESFDFSSL